MIDDPLKDTDLPTEGTVELDGVDQLMIVLHKRFHEQGGTGYCASLVWDGCVCAMGALALEEGHHPNEAVGVIGSRLVLPFGFNSTQPVYNAHDGAIREAQDRLLSGLKTTADGGVRALYGTPAYDFIMTDIERRLRDA